MEISKSTHRSPMRRFMDNEASSGIVLMAAAAAALAVANSPLASAYFGGLNDYVAGLSVLHWINDGFMAVFFMLVGLEIKREFIEGQLATWPQRILPAFAAAGGMIVPGLVYVALNSGSPDTLRGWAIPTATDIAFALGALALLGSRVPRSLKVFLATLAILDDLGAVTIIAVFYTDHLAPAWLAAAAGVAALLVALNLAGVRRLPVYLALGIVLWIVTLKSGVHATLAGVVLALTVPLRVVTGARSPLVSLEHGIQPWVAYLIVPIFGFANAGVSFAGMTPSILMEPVTLGIAAGLFLGKQIGVLSATWIATRVGIASRPTGATWLDVYGIALLCGIGFTMSLFIGLLAFPGAELLQNEVKVGVLVGSLASGLLGMAVLSINAEKDIG